MADLPRFIPDRDRLSSRHGFLTAVVNYLDRALDPDGGTGLVPHPNPELIAQARDKARREIQDIEYILAMAHLQAEKAAEEYIQGGAVL